MDLSKLGGGKSQEGRIVIFSEYVIFLIRKRI